MKRIFILGLLLATSLWAQSGLDILSIPTDARNAALGLSLSPTIKPTRLLTHPESSVTMSVWNWVDDIQGAYLGIASEDIHVSIQAMNSGDIEYRTEIPTEDPISTFEYNIFNAGGSYGKQLGPVIAGLGAELIHERSLNASATHVSMNLAAAYPLGSHLIASAGLRHLGLGAKLDEEKTELPSEAWLELDAQLGDLNAVTEFASGAFPLVMGLSYDLLDRFEFLGGVQVESADAGLRFHPSAGFTADWSNFTLGYAIHQFAHTLGPRHYFSLYWNY